MIASPLLVPLLCALGWPGALVAPLAAFVPQEPTPSAPQEAAAAPRRDEKALALLQAVAKKQAPSAGPKTIESFHGRFVVELFEEDDGTPRGTPRSVEVTWAFAGSGERMRFRREHFDRKENRRSIWMKDARGRHWSLGAGRPLQLDAEAHLAKDLDKFKDEIATIAWLKRLYAVEELLKSAEAIELMETTKEPVGLARKRSIREVTRVRLSFPKDEGRMPLVLVIDTGEGDAQHRVWAGQFEPREGEKEPLGFKFDYHTRIAEPGWTVPLEVHVMRGQRTQAEIGASPHDIRVNQELAKDLFTLPR